MDLQAEFDTLVWKPIAEEVCVQVLDRPSINTRIMFHSQRELHNSVERQRVFSQKCTIDALRAEMNSVHSIQGIKTREQVLDQFIRHYMSGSESFMCATLDQLDLKRESKYKDDKRNCIERQRSSRKKNRLNVMRSFLEGEFQQKFPTIGKVLEAALRFVRESAGSRV